MFPGAFSSLPLLFSWKTGWQRLLPFPQRPPEADLPGGTPPIPHLPPWMPDRSAFVSSACPPWLEGAQSLTQGVPGGSTQRLTRERKRVTPALTRPRCGSLGVLTGGPGGPAAPGSPLGPTIPWWIEEDKSLCQSFSHLEPLSHHLAESQLYPGRYGCCFIGLSSCVHQHSVVKALALKTHYSGFHNITHTRTKSY